MYTKKAHEHVNWKGEKATYNAKHKWLQRNYPRPIKCSDCEILGIFKEGKWTIDYANISKKYLRDIKDWKPLCRDCHWKFDRIESFECKDCGIIQKGIFHSRKRKCSLCLKKQAYYATMMWKRKKRAQKQLAINSE